MTSWRVTLALSLLLACQILVGCFGFRTINVPLETADPTHGYRPSNATEFGDVGEVYIYLAFSGGGTRAAALSYGVLEALRDTAIEVDGKKLSLLDEVDTMSGVSGGSFPAAYYGLFGKRIFAEFEDRFLRRNIQGAIIGRALLPWNLLALMTPWMSRSEIAKDIYDKSVFERATYADLKKAKGPLIYVNATDVASGERFVFTQMYFDEICSDLDVMPVAYAVAASSAVPALLSPVSLKNHAGTCGFEAPDVALEGLAETQADPRRQRALKGFLQFSDPQKRYVHLIDGGVSDNLGLRAGLDMVAAAGGVRAAAKARNIVLPRSVVMISVNAETDPPRKIDLSSASPGFAAMMNAVSGSQIRRYNFETLMLAHESMENWVLRAQSDGVDVHGYVIEVSLDNVTDPDERRKLKGVPTNFKLDDDDVDALRAAGRELLEAEPSFLQLLDSLARK